MSVTCSVVHSRVLPLSLITRDEYDRTRATITLEGEIDIACAPVLRGELDRHLAARRRVVRVDTYAVTFLDTAVLGTLLVAHRAWLAMRGTLVLIGVTGPTLRLLRLTGLDREMLFMPPAADRLMQRELVSAP
jgi:anti-sigma B factor antagonist